MSPTYEQLVQEVLGERAKLVELHEGLKLAHAELMELMHRNELLGKQYDELLREHDELLREQRKG